jgi:isomerase DpgB
MSTSPETRPAIDSLALQVDVECALPLEELTAGLEEVCDQAEKRDDGTVVVLRLRGTSADNREWPGGITVRHVNRWERAVRRLERLGAVVITAASGPCVGPALDLLVVADHRIGGPDLKLVLPVNDGHFWPGMSVYRLVQHLGMARARQIVLWGVDIPAERAVELGLVDEIHDDIPAALYTATVLTGRVSGKETTIRRQLLLEAGEVSYDEALGTHLAACDRELRRLQAGAERAEETEAARS